MKAGGVVLWLGGCASLSCSVDKPTREPIQPESWEDNFRLSVARPGKVEGELKADWVQSLQQSTPAFPCTICSSFGREFQLILYWKEEKHSLLVKKLSTSKSQVTIVSISLSSANAFPKNYELFSRQAAFKFLLLKQRLNLIWKILCNYLQL